MLTYYVIFYTRQINNFVYGLSLLTTTRHEHSACWDELKGSMKKQARINKNSYDLCAPSLHAFMLSLFPIVHASVHYLWFFINI